MGLRKLRPLSPGRYLPRKKRCVSILVALCLLYAVFYAVYSFSDTPLPLSLQSLASPLQKQSPKDDEYSGVNSVVDESIDDPQDFLDDLEERLDSIKISDDYNKYWRYYTELSDYKLRIDPESYRQIRKERHFYDPRITFAAYINHIRKLYVAGKPVNVPFSWQDWDDLSELNRFLEYKETEKPTCVDILTYEDDYTPRKRGDGAKSIERTVLKDRLMNQPCLDNKDYTGDIPKQLLPGFNFMDRDIEGNPWEKKAHAKSYLLSAMPPPVSLIFLSEHGVYRAAVTSSGTILDTGLYDELVADTKDQETGKILVDPVAQYRSLQKVRDPVSPGPDFDGIFTEANNYQYDIPKDLFYYDYKTVIEKLQAKQKSDDGLTVQEANHLDGLIYSAERGESELDKSFREVNLIWPPHDEGLKEHGDHYDWRFFNGFMTRMHINDYDQIEFRRKIILNRIVHTWQSFTYHTGAISLLAHGSLLSWYWDGLIFSWDDDIDIQMPIMELDSLCGNYNNSMIIEDATFGFHKYFLQCSNSLTHRSKGNGNNNIDARFIDVDSGMFIDITGLAFSGEPRLPPKYRRQWRKQAKEIEAMPATGYEFLKGYSEELQKAAKAREKAAAEEPAAEEPAAQEPAAAEAVASDNDDSEAVKAVDNMIDGKEGGKRLVKRANPNRIMNARRARAEKKLREQGVNPPAKRVRVAIRKETQDAWDRNTKLQYVNCRNNHFYSYDELSPATLSSYEGAPVLVPQKFKDILEAEYTRGTKRRAHKKNIYLEDLRFWASAEKLRMILTNSRSNSGKNRAYIRVLEMLSKERYAALTKLVKDEELLNEFYLTHDHTGDHLKEMKLRDKNRADWTPQEQGEYNSLMEKYKKYDPPMRKDFTSYVRQVKSLGKGENLDLSPSHIDDKLDAN